MFISAAIACAFYYQKTNCYRPFGDPLCGPGAIYFTIVTIAFFFTLGLRSFYLAWKKYQQEKKDKQNKSKGSNQPS